MKELHLRALVWGFAVAAALAGDRNKLIGRACEEADMLLDQFDDRFRDDLAGMEDEDKIHAA